MKECERVSQSIEHFYGHLEIECTGKLGLCSGENKTDAISRRQEIENFCLTLPRYKRPKKYIFADVPRNPTGKIEKPKLREIYGGLNIVNGENES